MRFGEYQKQMLKRIPLYSQFSFFQLEMTNLFFGGDGRSVVWVRSWGNGIMRNSNVGNWVVGNSNVGNWVVGNSYVGNWSNWVVGNDVSYWVGNFSRWCWWDWSFGSSLGYLFFNSFYNGWVDT